MRALLRAGHAEPVPEEFVDTFKLETFDREGGHHRLHKSLLRRADISLYSPLFAIGPVPTPVQRAARSRRFLCRRSNFDIGYLVAAFAAS
jgi:hypothetical protein